MLHAHHRERAGRDDEDHLPLEQVDERKGQDEQEERNGLLEMNAKNDRQRRLDTGRCQLVEPDLRGCIRGLVKGQNSHIRSMAPSWSVMLCTRPCMAFIPYPSAHSCLPYRALSDQGGRSDEGRETVKRPTAGPTDSKHPKRLNRKMVLLISCALRPSAVRTLALLLIFGFRLT